MLWPVVTAPPRLWDAGLWCTDRDNDLGLRERGQAWMLPGWGRGGSPGSFSDAGPLPCAGCEPAHPREGDGSKAPPSRSTCPGTRRGGCLLQARGGAVAGAEKCGSPAGLTGTAKGEPRRGSLQASGRGAAGAPAAGTSGDNCPSRNAPEQEPFQSPRSTAPKLKQVARMSLKALIFLIFPASSRITFILKRIENDTPVGNSFPFPPPPRHRHRLTTSL